MCKHPQGYLGVFTHSALGGNRTYNNSLGRSSYIHLTTRAVVPILTHCSFYGIRKYAILIFMSDNLTNEEKLDRMLKLTEENNKMLRSMHRSQTVSNIFRLLYWTLIIASIAGAYYFIKPMLTSFSGSGGSVLEQVNALKSQLPDPKVLQELLNGIEKQQ